METTDPYRMKTASSHDNQPEFRWKCEWEWRQSIALANWAAKTLGGSGGVIDLRDVLFFVSLIAFFLFTNVIVVEVKKSA